MKFFRKISLFSLAIIFQIGIIVSFIGRYEFIRSTGQQVYIETTGYDPNDIFRGEYVDIRYKLTLPQQYNYLFSGSNFVQRLYIVPKIENKIITGISSVSKEKPKNVLFFLAKDVSTQSSTQEFLIEEVATKQNFSYIQSWGCDETLYKLGQKILFSTDSGTIVNYITEYLPENISKETREGILKNIGKCSYTLTIQTPFTDKFYVQTGQGRSLEDKIQKGSLYAQWRVAGNGMILFEDIVEKKDIQ